MLPNQNAPGTGAKGAQASKAGGHNDNLTVPADLPVVEHHGGGAQ